MLNATFNDPIIRTISFLLYFCNMNMQLNLFEIPGEAGKPFLKLAGGKSQLTHEVIENLPTDIDEISTYVEPFIGDRKSVV